MSAKQGTNYYSAHLILLFICFNVTPQHLFRNYFFSFYSCNIKNCVLDHNCKIKTVIILQERQKPWVNLSNMWLFFSVIFFVTVQKVWRWMRFILLMLATSLCQIRVQGSDSLQGWPQWGLTLCLSLLPQGEIMFTEALSLLWYIKGTETDSSAQKKGRDNFFCH